MGNAKSLVLVVTSLTFLVSGAISSQLFVESVSARGPVYCFDNPQYGFCKNRVCGTLESGQVACCWTDTNSDERMCQFCDVNTDTGEFDNCSEVFSKGVPGSDIIAPPPLGVAPPPPTETCPENTVRDPQGNCAPMTQTPEEQLPSPEEIAPTVDCAENPDDPLCETARIPEAGDEDSDGGEDEAGGDEGNDGGDTNPDEG